MAKEPNWQTLKDARGLEGLWAVENGVVTVIYRDAAPAITHSSGPAEDKRIAIRLLRELAAAYRE